MRDFVGGKFRVVNGFVVGINFLGRIFIARALNACNKSVCMCCGTIMQLWIIFSENNFRHSSFSFNRFLLSIFANNR